MRSAFPVTGAILVGGTSSRMGRDKATLELGGVGLATRIAGVLRPFCDEVLLVGNQDVHVDGCRRVPDARSERSSLTGLYTALNEAASPLVLVVACDYPFVAPRLLEILLSAWRAGLWSVIPLDSTGLHPLLALHHRNHVPRLEARLNQGRFRIAAALHPLRVATLPWSSLQRLGVSAECFWNLNTPTELLQATRQLEDIDGNARSNGRGDRE